MALLAMVMLVIMGFFLPRFFSVVVVVTVLGQRQGVDDLVLVFDGVVEPGVISAAAQQSRRLQPRVQSSGRFKWCGSMLLPSTMEVTSTSAPSAESATDCATSPQIDVEVTIFRVSEPLLPSDPSLDASSEDAVEQADAKASAPMLSEAKATRRPR